MHVPAVNDMTLILLSRCRRYPVSDQPRSRYQNTVNRIGLLYICTIKKKTIYDLSRYACTDVLFLFLSSKDA